MGRYHEQRKTVISALTSGVSKYYFKHAPPIIASDVQNGEGMIAMTLLKHASRAPSIAMGPLRGVGALARLLARARNGPFLSEMWSQCIFEPFNFVSLPQQVNCRRLSLMGDEPAKLVHVFANDKRSQIDE